MSMEAMDRDMRTRFLVALVFALPIAVWSPMGEALFGDVPPTPFGLSAEVWQSGSSILVAANALLLKRMRLPHAAADRDGTT